MTSPSAKTAEPAATEYRDTKPNRTALILDRRTGKPLMRCTASRPGPSADARHIRRAVEMINAWGGPFRGYTAADIILAHLPAADAAHALAGGANMEAAR